MFSESEVIGLQAEKHELILPETAETPEEYTLFLIHRKAYELVARLATRLRVLDLGCNTGYGTSLIARTAASAIGVDVSERAIEEGRRRHPGLDLRLVDGRALPFAPASFDLVASFQVIEHVADTRGYLMEIKRVLSPGGIVVLTTPNAAMRLRPGMKPWNPFHVREYRAAELKALLDAQFSSTRIKGLFAREPLHGIEVRRAARLRDRSRRKQSRWYRLKTMLRRERGGDREGLTLADVKRYSTTAFHYRGDGLDGSLDLLALCTV